MTGIPIEIVEALDAVLRRLKQVNVHWHEALSIYFEPDRFRIAMQNCITTARSVTFILQNHKGVIPGFDAWYAPWQSRVGGDPIMRWAVQARNKIEKQGDLETLSQMRGELIAAYAGNPFTDWTTIGINWSTDQIRRSIPANLLSQHVIDNGVLSIERRWVDSELPDSEVLDALAHVYGQLALLVVSLHDHLGVSIPEHHPDHGEHLLRNLREDGRLPSMERPLEDRAVYIAVKDGSILGYRREFGHTDPDALKKVQRRYGHFKPAKHLTDSSTLMEAAKAYFDMARVVMARDGYHLNMFIPLNGARQIGLVVAPPENRADKYMLMRDIARYVRRIPFSAQPRITNVSRFLHGVLVQVSVRARRRPCVSRGCPRVRARRRAATARGRACHACVQGIENAGVLAAVASAPSVVRCFMKKVLDFVTKITYSSGTIPDQARNHP